MSYKNIEDKFKLLEELSSFKRKIGVGALRSLDYNIGVINLLQGLSFNHCWELSKI